MRKAILEFGNGSLSGALKKAKVKDELSLLRSSAFIDFASPKGFTKEVIEKHIDEEFAPVGPAKCCALFSNFNIHDAMIDLRKKYPWLYVHPCNMINFEEYGGSLATVKPNEYLKYKAMACCLNTDIDTGGGKHWVCIFCDFRGPTYTFEFFNSSGNGPGTVTSNINRKKEKGDIYSIIMNYLDNLASQMEGLTGKPCKSIIVTDIRNPHQKSNTECGPYCTYYIHKRCEGQSYKYFRDQRIPDRVVTDFRAQIFRSA